MILLQSFNDTNDGRFIDIFQVPDLVENFDEPSKNEAATTDAIADITEATNAVVDITETTEPEAVEAVPVVDKIEESSVGI